MQIELHADEEQTGEEGARDDATCIASGAATGVFPFLLINLSVLDPGLVKLTHICIMFFQRQPYACTYSADAQPCMNVCVVLRVLGCEHDSAARSSRPSSQPHSLAVEALGKVCKYVHVYVSM